MLVLSRKVGEKIVIGEGVELTVLEVNGSRVRLGVAAPDQCRILRAEKRPDEAVAGFQREAQLIARCGI